MIVLGVVLVLATAAGFGWRWASGRLRESRDARLTAAELGQPLGSRATVTAAHSPLPISARLLSPAGASRAGGRQAARPVPLLLTRRRTIDYCRVSAAPCARRPSA